MYINEFASKTISKQNTSKFFYFIAALSCP